MYKIRWTFSRLLKDYFRGHYEERSDVIIPVFKTKTGIATLPSACVETSADKLAARNDNSGVFQQPANIQYLKYGVKA